MDEQLSLLDWHKPEAEVVPLLEWLEGKGWMTASQIREAKGWSDRECRAAAEASKGLIITGQRGYRLLVEATPGEVEHAAAWLKSQGEKMIARSNEITTTYHRYGRPRTASAT